MFDLIFMLQMIFQSYTEELTLLQYSMQDGIEVISYELYNNGTPENSSPSTISNISSPTVHNGSSNGNGNNFQNSTIMIEKYMLWLDDNPDEPGLSRICLVKKSNLNKYKKAMGHMSSNVRESSLINEDKFHAKEKQRKTRGYTVLEEEDERLSKGLYLSDIAEVRHGCHSHVFRHVACMQPNPKLPTLEPSLCFSIIGSERNIDIQVSELN